MNIQMTQDEFDKHWPLLPPTLQKTLKQQVCPTVDFKTQLSNNAYMVGYASSHFECDRLPLDTYTWALAFTHQMLNRQALQEMVKNAAET